MKRDLGLRQDPALNERIAKLLFSTEPDLATTEIGTSGQGGNWMAAASMLQGAHPALMSGAESALQPAAGAHLAAGTVRGTLAPQGQ